jgi:hypothetical protein
MTASSRAVKTDSRNDPASDEALPEGGGAAREPSRDRPSIIPMGARVRVLAGSLNGQVGVVTEVDEKQGIRVQVGALRTWVREDELLLVGSERDRPMLRSSHRKDPKRGPSDP